MTGEEKKLTDVQQQKQKIIKRYTKIDKSAIEVIPAKTVVELRNDTSHKRVAAYCRVSTDNVNQTSSFVLQKTHYEGFIKEHPGWELVDIYADEGISGTSLAHRQEFNRMIEDALAGKIDLIITKSISRFARNTVDAISTVRKLAHLTKPVGVLFETENLYTLNQTSEMILTVLSAAAQEESHNKSEIMNISIDHRFNEGIFLTPKLLGYDKDEEGDLVINEDEAETVKVIFYLYINGFSSVEIAELLTEYNRKTKAGNTKWTVSSVRNVLQNERRCGDVLARKTYTPSFLDHKSRVNRGERKQYRYPDHHEGIVSRDVYQAANRMQAYRFYNSKNRPLPVMSVIDDGILKGYVPIDKDWKGFSPEDYKSASESVYQAEREGTAVAQPAEFSDGIRLDLSGYEIVRAQFFSTMREPALTISNGRMRFNTACLKKFEDVEYVELLLNSVQKCIAIRPTTKDNPNAIRWGRLKESRWLTGEIACRGLSETLYDMLNWDDNTKYRFRGEFIREGDSSLMLFQLEEPEMIKTEEIVIPPQEPEEKNSADDEQTVSEEIVIKRKLLLFPDSWEYSFGRPFGQLSMIETLVQERYGRGWDVLRPARQIEKENGITEKQLREMMEETEIIIEGWTVANG